MEENFIEMIKGRPIDLVVCSDAEAILGIGDQGVGGIGVSILARFPYRYLTLTSADFYRKDSDIHVILSTCLCMPSLMKPEDLLVAWIQQDLCPSVWTSGQTTKDYSMTPFTSSVHHALAGLM
jgi:hypothetical protein